jgi:predicted lipoprotein with Yx(FWY)xxD motif
LKLSLRHTVVAALAAALVFAAAAPVMAAGDAAHASDAKKRLVSMLRADNLGATVLARGNKQALYYWSRESDGKIRCVGACAAAWPPYIVPRNAKVPRKVAGFAGTFGTVTRPDGRRQLTYDGRPLYTYAHEPRGVVLCDDVDGWFAIRL